MSYERFNREYHMDDLLKLGVVCLDNQYYGIKLEALASVFRAARITPIPNQSPQLLGILNIHGDIYSVIDIRQLLGLMHKKLNSKDYLILIQQFSKSFIIIVDWMVKIIEFYESELMPFEGLSNQYIKGVLKKENHLILVLDIESLFATNDNLLLQSSTKAKGIVV